MRGQGRYNIRRACSLPEAAVYYYLSRETAAVWSYFPRFLEGMEIDVFLPIERAAVEYDGAEWHRDRRNEERKDRLCRENGVRLLRIRETGADPIPGDVVWTDPGDRSSLADAIREACSRLLGKEVDVDLERDEAKIRRLLEERTPTVASSRPWLLPQVSPSNPFGPEEVGRLPVNSPETVLWRCWSCGRDYRDYPGKRAAPLCPACAGLGDPMGLAAERDGPYSENVVVTDFDRSERERRGIPLPGLRRMDMEGEELWWRPSGRWSSPWNRLWWWRCPYCGYRWVSSEENRMLGDGCPQCGHGWRPNPGLPVHHADVPYLIPPEPVAGIERKVPARKKAREKRPKSQTTLGSFREGRSARLETYSRASDLRLSAASGFSTLEGVSGFSSAAALNSFGIRTSLTHW